LAALSPGYVPHTRWQAFEAYTTRAMTARLADVFDRVLARQFAAATEGTSFAYSGEARR
jgi:hypothetical protein